MRTLKLSITALTLLVAVAGAFATKTESKRFVTRYGILSTGSDAGGAYYNVETFSSSKICNTGSGNCSFNYPTAGQTKVYQSDPNISSLQPGVYQ